MRAVGMESNEEGEIPLIQEPPLKKTKMLLYLAGGESDGKNRDTHFDMMGEMSTWILSMSVMGVIWGICFDRLEAT